jgi:hypothetical protein
MSLSSLLLESVIIGIITAFVLLLWSNLITPNTTFKIIIIGFLTGSVIHIIFDLLKINKYYCNTKK